ncbi:unnamed protein product [Brachionus calyciflorus]|uniref:Uncharacterized protein n=1 Tax=Brachionus calyciflorus TaxID=104777 RepID=A0A814FLA8_9BILA|nr:unnamed protein product [Brachionus calyciflorus]
MESFNFEKRNYFLSKQTNTSFKIPITRELPVNYIPIEKNNESDAKRFSTQIPLNQYPVNKEPFSEIINLKPNIPIRYAQKIGIRYLEPPEIEKPGNLIIRQLPNKQIPPAPPLIIRQIPRKPPTPPPIYIRDAPPKPLPKVNEEIINIPGKILPPPPRQLIFEKLPPLPPKPQTVIIDKWLPYKPQKRKIIYENLQHLSIEEKSPKNILIEWDKPEVEIERQVINLGVFKVDPQEYTALYGKEFNRSEELNQILNSIKMPPAPFQNNVNIKNKTNSFYNLNTLRATKSYNEGSKDLKFDSTFKNKKRVSFLINEN